MNGATSSPAHFQTSVGEIHFYRQNKRLYYVYEVDRYFPIGCPINSSMPLLLHHTDANIEGAFVIIVLKWIERDDIISCDVI